MSWRPQVYRLADTFLLRVPGEKSLRALRVTGNGVAVPCLPEGTASVLKASEVSCSASAFADQPI